MWACKISPRYRLTHHDVPTSSGAKSTPLAHAQVVITLEQGYLRDGSLRGTLCCTLMNRKYALSIWWIHFSFPSYARAVNEQHTSVNEGCIFKGKHPRVIRVQL